MIQEFADWVEAQTGRTLGDTLHAGWRPDDAPDLCTVILQRVPAPRSMDGADVDERPIQFITRAGSYMAAEAEAKAIHAALIHQAGHELPSLWILTITGSSPAHLGPDSTGRHEFTFNLTVRTRNFAP